MFGNIIYSEDISPFEPAGLLLTDIEQNGTAELVFIESGAGSRISARNLNSSYFTTADEWPMAKHDYQLTSTYIKTILYPSPVPTLMIPTSTPTPTPTQAPVYFISPKNNSTISSSEDTRFEVQINPRIIYDQAEFYIYNSSSAVYVKFYPYSQSNYCVFGREANNQCSTWPNFTYLSPGKYILLAQLAIRGNPNPVLIPNNSANFTITIPTPTRTPTPTKIPIPTRILPTSACKQSGLICTTNMECCSNYCTTQVGNIKTCQIKESGGGL
jgi:hypothetical protein